MSDRGSNPAGSRSAGAGSAASSDAPPPFAVLGVDGGNSKVELALADDAGRIVTRARGDTISHQQIPLRSAMIRLEQVVDAALVAAGAAAGTRPAAHVAVMCLAGADHASEVRLLERAISALGLAPELLVRNDTFAALRAGSDRPWGIAVICGAGINGVGVAPDGRVASFAALGQISGDRAGGIELGWGALAAAVRARDGRGPRTILERSVPAVFGLRTPNAVTLALYHGRLPEARIRELAPLVFQGVLAGDPASIALADALADEAVAYVRACCRRLRLARLDVPVVLAGTVLQHAPERVVERIRVGVRAIAPRATVSVLAAAPVDGAVLLGLDHLRAAG